MAVSLYKVGLSLVACDMVNKGEISMRDLVYYQPWQFVGGTGILQYNLNFNTLTVDTLIEYSIKYSDNIAATMLYTYVGGWYNYKYRLFEILNIMGNEDNISTAGIELATLKYIYENKDNPNYSTLIEYLKDTTFHDRLDKYILQEITAHKIGTYEVNTHNIGIVFTEEPYIIIVMSNNLYNAPKKIANISKIIYEYNTGRGE